MIGKSNQERVDSGLSLWRRPQSHDEAANRTANRPGSSTPGVLEPSPVLVLKLFVFLEVQLGFGFLKFRHVFVVDDRLEFGVLAAEGPESFAVADGLAVLVESGVGVEHRQLTGLRVGNPGQGSSGCAAGREPGGELECGDRLEGVSKEAGDMGDSNFVL